MILRRESTLFGCGMLLFATVAFALGATGEYTQTRDGKTTVWNGNAKAGESASWAGSRDKDGYATGFGTITWYNADGTESAVYYGNMVNGKLEGPVNAHVGRRTAHAYFADGTRETAWARGAAPSKMNVPEGLIAKRRKAESEQPKPQEKEQTAETKKKPKPESEKVRPIEETRRATAAETKTKPAPAETPREEIQTPTPESVAVSTPSPPAVAESTPVSTPAPTETASSLFEPPAIAETRETPKEIANETPQPPPPEPSVEKTPEIVEQPPAEEPPKKSPAENAASLNALVGPPSSLRSGSIREPSKPEKPRSISSPVRGRAELTEDEAIGLADVEARGRGFDLNEYQRPKTDYSAVKDKWSLFYNLKDPKAAGGDLQPFSVTVEDKSKKVELRKNY
jgi:hypothetical protein